MDTPQRFLELFLEEKRAAWAEARPKLTSGYAKYFGEPLSQRAEQFMPRDVVRVQVEDVKQSGSIASAVTREHFKTADICTRYRLAAEGESWRIIGIDRKCYFCHGTGKFRGSQCQNCAGGGWHDSTDNTV